MTNRTARYKSGPRRQLSNHSIIQKDIFKQYDMWVLLPALCLVLFGLLMVTSASMVISDRQYGYSLHYFIRQAIFILFSLGGMYIISLVPSELWSRFSGYFMIMGLLLLLLVLIPGIGKVVNGSRRWLSFGIISLQVSEIAKFVSVIYLASYLHRRHQEVSDHLKGFVKPMILLTVMAVLLLLEPDFGSLAVMSATFLILLFLAGVRLWPFCVILIVSVALLALIAVMSPYRMARLTTFVNPWLTQFGSGYQLTQSLIAFGRGGIDGVGLGNSVQKLFYLPEAHTDFIFAVIGEELGLIGELSVVAVYALLVGRILWLSKLGFANKQLFKAYVAFGFATWLALQAMVNIGVNIGILPTKGLTLPFMSYGGSSVLVNFMVIGLILRLSYELRSKQAARRVGSSRFSKKTHNRR